MTIIGGKILPDYLFRGNLAKLDPDVYELAQIEAERQVRKVILCKYQ